MIVLKTAVPVGIIKSEELEITGMPLHAPTPMPDDGVGEISFRKCAACAASSFGIAIGFEACRLLDRLVSNNIIGIE